MTTFTPREIVSELDRFIVGQNTAKRAVAIALRNRWRRQQIKGSLKDEVLPKNLSPALYLKQLVDEGAKKRWPNGISDKVKKQINYELSVIKKLCYSSFLFFYINPLK